MENFTGLIEDLSFFFEIYSIDKEETSIMTLKSFSYKVISTDMLVVCITIILYELTCQYNFITLYVLYTK